jgi:hypothetical protein
MSPNTENGELNPIAKNLTLKLNILLASTVIVYLIVLGLSIYGATVAGDLKDGVCGFVDDLDARVEQGQDFLAKNPDGFGGLDADTLQNQINGQQRTANVLRQGVNCK